ncbi:hypothetical protein TNIN_189211 [Trichonephila inaurata madagascariensis]|uniref:Uncharacterized protein n=1 Tax=Trichonephila inaurata madagascariensis TaxID=2747483 RepID=A0A8X6WR61_9ARAC|nr:hypothetical protein TNIN_189211 [Trichonephila inaurata madagascariensis]
MLEKADKVKANNKKPSKKQKGDVSESLSLILTEEIPLNTSGDSFDEDNNDDFCAVYKGYFYAMMIINNDNHLH